MSFALDVNVRVICDVEGVDESIVAEDKVDCIVSDVSVGDKKEKEGEEKAVVVIADVEAVVMLKN